MAKSKKAGPEPEFSTAVAHVNAVETDEIVKNIGLLAQMQSTEVEAAAALGMTPLEFAQFLVKNPRSNKAWFSGAAFGRANIRRMQMTSAAKGSVAMQRFLGKQYLGQSDNPKPELPTGLEGRMREAWDRLSSWRMQKLG